MNIQDVEDFKLVVEPRDLLKMMIDKQKELMEKYGEIERRKGIDSHHPIDIHTCRGQQRVKDLMWRIVEELGEAANCLKNKPWKKSELSTDVDHFNEELSDALHFFLELLISVHIDSADKIANLYLKKARVNKFRQRSNY